MLNIKKILFPTDFSEYSKLALRHAVKLAQEQQAELHLLHAIVLHEDDPYELTHQFPDPTRIRRILEEVAARRMGELVKDHELPDLVLTQVHRRDVSAAPPIVEYAKEADIDLIVMGTHGRRGVRRLLLGSVASEVIRLAPCSVLTIRTSGKRAPVHELSRILLPTDFSDPGEEALGAACAMAASYGSQLQVLHVVEDLLHPTFYNTGATKLSDLQPDILRRAQSELAALLAKKGICREIEANVFVREGHPGREIIRFSKEQGADLIAMATHGLRGIRDFLLGSTTEHVMASAECPVLVVRASGKPLVS